MGPVHQLQLNILSWLDGRIWISYWPDDICVLSELQQVKIFLSNRLNKALIGLAETDKAVNNWVSEKRTTIDNDGDNQDVYEFQNILNKILSDYYWASW